MVFKHQDLNRVTWEQRVMEDNPKFAASHDISSAVANMIGLRSFYIDDAERMAAVWDQAYASDRPVVIGGEGRPVLKECEV